MLGDDDELALGSPPDAARPNPGAHPDLRYRVWKKHVRSMYQTLFVNSMDFPTTTVQLMPYVRRHAKESLVEHFMLVGTCPPQDPNATLQSYLMIVKAACPASNTQSQSLPIDAETGEFGGYGHASSSCRMTCEKRMYHDGGVRRARFLPTNPNLLASVSTNGNVYVFDMSFIGKTSKPNNPPRALLPQEPPELEANNVAGEASRTGEAKRMKYDKALEDQKRFDADTGKGQHKLTLVGGDAGGGPAAMDVNVSDEGVIMAAFENRVLLWKVGGTSPTEEALHVYRAKGSINDVKFDKRNPNLIYAACEASHGVCMFDIRVRDQEMFTATSDGYLVSVDVNPFRDYVALGNSEGMVEIRDVRKMDRVVVKFAAHVAGTEVGTLAWSPHAASLLASAGEDGNVVLTELLPEGGAGVHPRFKHTGHKDNVDDVSWSWSDAHKGTIATCSTADQTMMLWKPRNHVWT